jgi:hypothetical protein
MIAVYQAWCSVVAGAVVAVTFSFTVGEWVEVESVESRQHASNLQLGLPPD